MTFDLDGLLIAAAGFPVVAPAKLRSVHPSEVAGSLVR
jgi:hypothetical protein